MQGTMKYTALDFLHTHTPHFLHEYFALVLVCYAMVSRSTKRQIYKELTLLYTQVYERECFGLPKEVTPFFMKIILI